MSEAFYNAKNFTVSNGFVRNPDRYYLEEYFNHLVVLNQNLVTQSTNHTTAVTLNAPSGIIILAASALAASTNAEFTFTNSYIKSTSQILLTVQDENTTDNAQLTLAHHTLADGSCKITIINSAATGATSATASKIHFKILDIESNKNFEVLGTNMTTALCTFNPDAAGIIITTAGADEDQAIIAPNLNTNQTAWTNIMWGTDNQVEWECAINLPAIDNQKVWAGLKLTNDQLIATDLDQAFFKFQTDADNSETFTDFTKLHFIYTISSTSTTYISQLPITVTANTNYNLRISIDSNRYLSIFVNGVQYNITTTVGATGGTTVTAGTTSSKQLTNAIDLKPYIGIEAGTSGAESLHVYYQKISRVLS